MMDEVRVWNVARTAERIKANYQRSVPAGSPGLVGYWKFDETMGQTLLDSAGGNNAARGRTADYEYSDPLLVPSTVPLPPIGQAKVKGPGWGGAVAGVVTAVFPDYDSFVVEAEDRSSAITVTPLAPYASRLREGREAAVTGVVQDDGTFLADALWLSGWMRDIFPLGMSNKVLGGAGLSSADLLIATWGKALDVPAALPDGSTRFRVTDGSDVGAGKDVVEVKSFLPL